MNVALVGAGVIARHHAAAVARHAPQARLRVYDPSPEAVAGLLQEFPAATRVDRLDDLLDHSGDPGIAIIATPPFTHTDLTLKALAAGWHVLCEKPWATSVEDARRMFAAAQAARRHLGSCANRFLDVPATTAVRTALAEGRLGSPYLARTVQRQVRSRCGVEYQPRSRWFLDRAQSGGGPLLDWGVYDVAVMVHVLQPTAVTVRSAWTAHAEAGPELPPGTRFDVETHGGAQIEVERCDGSRVIWQYERASCCHGPELAIQSLEGSSAAVDWDWLPWVGGGAGATRWRSDREGSVFESAEHRPLSDAPVAWTDLPFAEFLRLLRGEPHRSVADAEALAQHEVIFGIYSVAAGGPPVHIAWPASS